MASERERAQTKVALYLGLWIDHKFRMHVIEEAGKLTVEGNSPVSENEEADLYPEYHETRETLWEAGGTTSQG